MQFRLLLLNYWGFAPIFSWFLQDKILSDDIPNPGFISVSLVVLWAFKHCFWDIAGKFLEIFQDDDFFLWSYCPFTWSSHNYFHTSSIGVWKLLQAILVHGFQLLDIWLHHSAGNNSNCQISKFFNMTIPGIIFSNTLAHLIFYLKPLKTVN